MSYKRLSMLAVILTLASILSGCGGGSKSPTVAVTASVTTVDGADTVTLTATVANDKAAGGVSWSVSGGGTLSNATTSSATYTAPAATSAAQTVTVTATSVADTTKTGSVTLTIAAKPAITTPTGTQLTGAVGAAYSLQLAETGGIAPYTWTLTAGTLPTGWTLTAGGLLSGPAPVAGQAGTFSLTFKVTDSGTPTALTDTLQMTVTIDPAAAIAFSGLMPTTATYASSAPYVGFATATGGAGSVTYSVASGALPPGIILMSTSNGQVGGTPTAVGTYNFTIQAADAYGDSATQAYTITVNQATPTLAFAAIPAKTYGDAAFTVSASSASSGAVTYSVTSGPATIAGNKVTITGVGTVVLGASQAATTNYTAATATTSFTVAAEVPALSFAAIPTHTYGDAPFTVSATSVSSGAVTYSVTSGPATVSGATVTLTGAGTVVLGASQAADGNYAAATATVSFTVAALAPTLSFAAIPTHTFGDAPFAVSATSASSGAVTYSVTSGPATVSGATVTLTGGGTVVLGASQAADGGYGPATATISFTVDPGTPTLSFAAIPAEMVGNAPFAVSATSASSGTVTYSVTSGPATIAGNIVTLTGTGTVVLGASQAANADYIAATATTSFTVYPTLSVNTMTLPVGYPGTSYPNTTFTATGGSGTPYTWKWAAASGSALPTGIGVSTAGVIAGTPVNSTSSSVVSNVVVTATDSAGNAASANFSLTIEATLTIATPTPLATGVVGAVYSTTLAATGGTGSYTWTVPSSTDLTCLSGLGLSLSGTGVLSSGGATLTSGNVGTCTNFGVQVSDNAVPAHTASVNLTVAVSAVSITPASLGPIYTGSAYSQQLTASSGTGPYTWSVTAGASQLSAVGLSFNTTNATLSGTAGSLVAGTATFTVKATDSTSASGTRQFTITVYNPLAQTPNPNPLPSVLENASYNAFINATGGDSNYSWTVTGLPANGFSYTNNGSNLSITGTAPSTPQTVTFNVTLTDATLGTSVGPTQYSIVVNSPGHQVSGNINLGGCNSGSSNTAQFNVDLYSGWNTTSGSGRVQNQTTTGDFTFTNIPDGQYTVVPSISGPSALFYPASQNITVSGGDVTGSSFNVLLGYTVTGTVNYGGSKSGQVYLTLNNSSCGGTGNQPGSSIAAKGSYTINGVPPGTYTLSARMDTQGFGAKNAGDPAGSASVSVSNANVSNADVTLNDPSAVTLSSGPNLQQVSPAANGVAIPYQPITDSNDVELATSYKIQWSTDSGFGSIAGSKTVPANGDATDVWMVAGVTGGQTYFFRAQGIVGTTAGPWSVYGGGTPTAVIINPSTSGNTITGTVTFSGTATGPLMAGFYSPTKGVYTAVISSPVSPQSYTVHLPNGTDYVQFGIIDQNNDGIIDAGDISNISGGDNSATTTISGDATMNLTLPSASSTADVRTQYWQQTSSGGSNSDYELLFAVRQGNKLPVKAQLTSGPNVIYPIDVAACGDCGQPQFRYNVGLNGATPTVGDAYVFHVTYGDGTSEDLTANVSGWNGTSSIVGASDLVTNMSPSGNTGGSSTPNFTWTYPTNPSNFIYQFYLRNSSYNQMWAIPAGNSKLDGFTSSQIPVPAGIQWPTDPTNSGNHPSGSLTSGTYYWQINVQDSVGNLAQVQKYFIVP